MNDNNMECLQMNGVILYIRRPLDALLVSEDRPLSSSVHAIHALYEQRKDRYEYYADAIIENKDDLEIALHQMLEQLETI